MRRSGCQCCVTQCLCKVSLRRYRRSERLRRRLRLPNREDASTPVNVVVQTEDGAVSLLVDKIGDVFEVEDESFERAPETLQGEAKDLIRGAYKLESKLLLILDTEKAISATAESS